MSVEIESIEHPRLLIVVIINPLFGASLNGLAKLFTVKLMDMPAAMTVLVASFIVRIYVVKEYVHVKDVFKGETPTQVGRTALIICRGEVDEGFQIGKYIYKFALEGIEFFNVTVIVIVLSVFPMS